MYLGTNFRIVGRVQGGEFVNCALVCSIRNQHLEKCMGGGGEGHC